MYGTHHLHAKKHQSYKRGRLLGWDSPKLFIRGYERLMYGVAIVSPLALVPQILHIYRTHDVSSLTISTWAILGGVNVLWLIYGALHKAYPVILANILFATLNFAGVIAIVLYR